MDCRTSEARFPTPTENQKLHNIFYFSYDIDTVQFERI